MDVSTYIAIVALTFNPPLLEPRPMLLVLIVLARVLLAARQTRLLENHGRLRQRPMLLPEPGKLQQGIRIVDYSLEHILCWALAICTGVFSASAISMVFTPGSATDSGHLLFAYSMVVLLNNILVIRQIKRQTQ